MTAASVDPACPLRDRLYRRDLAYPAVEVEAEGHLQRLRADDESAAAGPQALNTYMPPYGPMPTTAGREQLGRWLACAAP